MLASIAMLPPFTLQFETLLAMQVEGAFVMGLGVLGTEQVEYDSKTGKLHQDSTWTYKVPSATCVPRQLNVAFLEVRMCPLP